MKPILTRLFAGLFLLVAAQAYGQFTTSFVVTSPGPAPSYPIGTHLVVELRVNGFTNIVSMQFPIGFNKDALRFDSLSNAAFSNWSAGNFNGNNTVGRVGIAWDGFSNGASMPFTFPNGTALFKLHFTVINNGTSVININPAVAPPSIEVMGANGPINPNYQSGGTPTITLGTGAPPPPPLVGFKIVANTIFIPEGQRGCMPITVNDFDNILSMQWAINWDNTKINFECVRGFNLPGWSANSFNPITPGTLLVGWDDPAGVGVTRADGVRIVDVCFKAVGAPASSATVMINGMGFPPGNGSAEAFNSNSVDVWTAANHPNGASGVSAPVTVLSTPASPFDVTYTVDTVAAAQNTQACVEVKVKNFTAVTSAEFALNYKTAQLTYVNTDYGSNPLNLQASNVVHPNPPMGATDGAIKFQWSSANGATVADNTPIFKSCFTVIAPEGTTCPITFTTTPCPSITGFGTAKSTGGVPYANVAGWIKSATQGPTINIVQDVSCVNGTNGSLTVVNPATLSATSYAWSNAGTAQTISNLGAGIYTVTVTYSNGTTLTATKTLAAPAAIVTTTMVNTVSCAGGTNGAVDLTVSGGTSPYTYLWDNGATTQDIMNIGAGIYTVTVTDFRSCTKTQTASVSGFIAMMATPTVTNISCAGLTNGAISMNVTGGAGNYAYAWSSGETTKDLAGKAAGTYTLTVTDANNCTRSFTATITAPQPIVPQLVSKTDVRCMNTPTGAATINITGGTGNMTYCWSSAPGPCASQVQNPTNLPPATYVLIATDANGCTGTLANVTIANPPSALTVQGSTTPSPCFDQPSGSIISNGSGGWGTSYTYAWSGPVPLGPVSNHMPVPGGTYTVTVTDANQCSATSTFVVSGAPQITQNAAVTHVACFGTNNGAINLNLAGGNQPFQSVVWSNTTLVGQSISNLAPGNYQPTVTDALGCSKIFTAIAVNGPQVLTIDTTIAEANPNNGSINLEILSGGTPGFTYQWSNGATTQDISNLPAGIYTVSITDANNCLRTFSFEVPNGNVLGQPTVSSVQNSCAADGCINLNIASTAAAFTPITLNWGFGTMQTNSLTPSICNLPSGVYNITVTASNGNSSVLSGVQVAQLDPASVNSNTTNPFSSLTDNGKITLTKASSVQCDLQYQWGPAPLNSTSNEVSNLAQGTYFVTITNPCSGCVNIEQFDLEYSPLQCAGFTVNPDCATTPDGSINATVQGGKLPYSYSWTGPNGFVEDQEDLSSLNAGVYLLVATDQDGRTCTLNQPLTAQSPLNITNVNETSLYGTFQVSGANVCDGAATLVFIPGIGSTSIQWSNGVTSATNTTLCAGAYSVTLTDAQGCTATWVDELTAPAPIALTSTNAPVLKCYGDCDGTARITIGGGVGPYSVRWSTGQFDPLVTANGFSQAVNLCGGDYQVTVTDEFDVQQIFTVTVPEPAPITADFAATAPRNFNACDGDILISLTGAAFPVTYVWSGNFGHTGNTERAEELCSGEFVEFFVTDANGCIAYFSDSIPYPEDGCFRVSPVITPGQQDGKNDFVVITCIETAFENTMEIYNRWGQLVFETENYTNNDSDPERNWNGLTSTGAVLAEGVYYYVLTFKYLDDQGITREGTRKGAINLLR